MDIALFEEEINFIAQKGQEYITEIQSWRQDFSDWIAAVKEEYVQKKKSQTAGSSIFVPPTPAACVKRRRPKLSVVKEQEDEEDTQKPLPEEAAGAAEGNAAEDKAESPERRPVRRAARQASTRFRGQSSVMSKKGIVNSSSSEDSEDDKPLRVTRASKRISAKRRNTGAKTRGSEKPNDKSLRVTRASKRISAKRRNTGAKTRGSEKPNNTKRHKKRTTAQEGEDENSSESEQEGGAPEEQKETLVERSSVKRALADDGSSDVQSEDLNTTNRNSRKKTKSLDDSRIKAVRKSSHKIAVLEASSLEEDDLVETNTANQLNVTQVLSSERGSAAKPPEVDSASEEPVPMEVDNADREAVGERAGASTTTSTIPSEDVDVDAPSDGRKKEKDQRPKSSVLFSPYNNDPVKKRVAAYETLKPVTEEPEKVSPVRMTRTKTRAKAAAAAASAASVAAAAAAAAAQERGYNQKEKQLLQKSARNSLTRAKKQLLVKLHKPILPEDSKENSEHGVSKYPVISLKKTNRTPLTASKILMDLNGQSTNKGNSRTTPLNTSKPQINALSTSHINRNITLPGIIVSNVETFITKAPKAVQNVEAKKIEDLKKWKEKEQEAQRKKEEHLKMRAEQSKKQEEKRLKVLQNREAQEREKQAALLRFGHEKDEKMKQANREREARQREEALKRKQQALQKAAEAEERRKQEEAVRQAKLKLEEEQAQLRREQEEAERAERQRQRQRAEDEKAVAAALQREKAELQAKEKAKEKKQKEVAIQKAPKDLNSTWVNPGDTGEYDLGEISCDSTDDEAAPKKKIATWAQKHALIETAKGAALVTPRVVCDFFQSKTVNPDMSKLFDGYKRYKRASSQFWKTPPRYSELPKY